MAHDYDKFPELTNTQLEEFGFTSPHKQITEDFVANVIKVTDGDTITLHADFRDFDFPLRLAKIDSQELSEGGSEAKDWLKGLIEGEKVDVKINFHNRVGRYGRLIGEIVSRGLNVNDLALSGGYAVPFGTKNEHLPVPVEKMFRVGQWF